MPFFIFSLINFFLWNSLYKMFPFADHDKSPFFFFKIVGQASLSFVYDTLFIFSLLVLVYIANYIILKKEHTISFVVKFIFFLSIFGAIANCILLYPIGSRDIFDYLLYIKLAYFYHGNPYTDSLFSYTDTFTHFGFLLYSPLVYGP